MLTDLKLAAELGVPIRIPAGSLAQSWRGGPRSASIARLLKQPCVVVPINQASAKEVGEYLASQRLGENEKPDVVDAHVAFVARSTKSLVWTSDPDDMVRYGVEDDFIRKL